MTTIAPDQLLDYLSNSSLIRESGEDLYALASGLYSHGRYQDASACFRILALGDQLKAKYWFALGASLQMEKKYYDAAPAFLIAANLDLDDPLASFHQAECLIAGDLINEGLEALSEARARAIKQNNSHLVARIEACQHKYTNHYKIVNHLTNSV